MTLYVWDRERLLLSTGVTYLPGNLCKEWLSLFTWASLHAVTTPRILPSAVTMLGPPHTTTVPGPWLSALTVYSRSDSCTFLNNPGSRMLTHVFFPAKVTALITGLLVDAQTCSFLFFPGPIQLRLFSCTRDKLKSCGQWTISVIMRHFFLCNSVIYNKI